MFTYANLLKYANNNAIIYNNNGIIIYKTYLDLYNDIISTYVDYKEQFIYNLNRYDSLVKQLACVFNNRIFCHLPNSSSDEYIEYIKQTIFKNSIPDFTTHIIASSGTTGTPKLVALNFNKALVTIKHQSELCNITEKSIVSCFLSYAFDASMSDIYIALTNGACLYLTETPLTSIKKLNKEIKEFKLTHLDIPPSILKFINFSELIDIKTLIFGGELADENIVKSISKLGIKCFNAYGPTENSICTNMRLVTDDWKSNNIGVPLYPAQKSKSFKIINKELYLPQGLFNGYIGNDILYKQKVLIINNQKYFATGDLVIYKNKELYYIGRKDRQFKNNGILICPEEIELAARNSGCTYAVISNTSPLTLTHNSKLSTSDLLNEMSKYLPKTRIPKVFIHKDLDIEESLTKNGKTKKI